MESLLFEPTVDLLFREPAIGLDFAVWDQTALRVAVNGLYIDFEKRFYLSCSEEPPYLFMA